MTSSSPFQLELSLQKNKVQAFLINTSSQEQIYFYDTQLQPSQLLIEDKDHHMMKSFDQRSAMKFDNTPYNELYRKLSPHTKVLLQSTQIEKRDDNYYFVWNPFEYELSITGAPYQFILEWQSLVDQSYDSETRQYKQLSLWKGKLTSNRVELP